MSLNVHNWRSRDAGEARWKVVPSGKISVKGEGCPRTPGAPVTVRTFQRDYGEALDHAVEKTGVDRALIAATAITESAQTEHGYHRDSGSVRYERSRKEYSLGLMQILQSTARDVCEREGILDGDPTWADLCCPWYSLLIGAHYLADLSEREDTTDPVLLRAAYNAGEVEDPPPGQPSAKWGLHVYDDTVIDRFIRWHNDWIEGVDDE